MRKRIIRIAVLTLLIAVFVLTLASCSGSDGETYYRLKGASIDESSWLKIGKGKLEDSDGEKGTYELDGDMITIYLDDEELMSGTCKSLLEAFAT